MKHTKYCGKFKPTVVCVSVIFRSNVDRLIFHLFQYLFLVDEVLGIISVMIDGKTSPLLKPLLLEGHILVASRTFIAVLMFSVCRKAVLNNDEIFY